MLDQTRVAHALDKNSVVIASLEKIDSLATHLVDQPMLLRDSSGPYAAKLVLEGLRLANTLEWILQDILNQQQGPKSCFPVRLHQSRSCRNSGWNTASI